MFAAKTLLNHKFKSLIMAASTVAKTNDAVTIKSNLLELFMS